MERSVYSRLSQSRLARLLICLVFGAAIAALPPASQAAVNAPIRAFWMMRDALESADAITRAIAAAVSDAVDTIMVPVSIGTLPPTGFDGVREMVRQARDRGLRVHAWIDVNLVAVASELPASRDHVIYQHPEWLMVPRELAPELVNVDVRSPAYFGRLARWVRQNAARIDGLYVSPLDPDAAAYLVTVVSAAVKRYGVDGVFLDSVKFPGPDFDYSRHAMDLFRGERRTALTPSERARLDDVEAIDPFAYTEEFPDEWRAFRRSRLTALLTQLKSALVLVNPTMVLSAGVARDPNAALAEFFQDWAGWMGTGLIDGVARRTGTSGTIVFTADGIASIAGKPVSANQIPSAVESR